MIRSTMTAVPKRLPVLWAKAGVYAVVALAIAIPTALIAFFAGQAILSGQHIQIAFSHTAYRSPSSAPRSTSPSPDCSPWHSARSHATPRQGSPASPQSCSSSRRS
jgi:hypothetical protein